MKQRIVLSTVLVVELLFPIALLAQARGQGLSNPKPFQNFLAPPSATVSFLASDRGRALLRKSPTANAIAILKALGEDVTDLTPISPPKQFPAIPARVSASTLSASTVGPCGTTTGSRFNSFEDELGARPQNEQSVDFLFNRVHTTPAQDLVMMGANDYRGFIFDPLLPFLEGGTGYYVSRGDDPCSNDFEGALPPLDDPLSPGFPVFGQGDPVVAADPSRDAFFMADLRVSFSSTSIGLFRSSASRLVNTANCPNGLHTTADSERCWPTHTLINTLPEPFVSFFQDKPSMTVDERASGTGAGNVYITATEFDFSTFVSRIWLVSCNNALTACSSPVIISGTDTATQFSDVRVRPGSGIVTVTYVNSNFATFPPNVDVKYVSCSPAAAPATPSCFPAGIVANETQPLFILAASDFRIATYPTHDHRTESNGTETYVAWSRCKVPGVQGFICPDADVVMKASKNNGATWSALADVNADADDQFFPWVKTDRSQNVVNVLYYDNNADSGFQHRVQVKLAQIFPGAATPDVVRRTRTVASTLNEPDGDVYLGGFFFGDYIGVAARGTGAATGSRAHVGYTANYFLGSYNGAFAPQQDNWHNQIKY
jgi:hypothetical protein